MALAKRIIPCLDVDKGRVVKGVQFLDIRDAGDPVEIAKNTMSRALMKLPFLTLPPATRRATPLYTQWKRLPQKCLFR